MVGNNAPSKNTIRKEILKNSLPLREGLDVEQMSRVAKEISRLYDEKKIEKVVVVQGDATATSVRIEALQGTNEVYGLVGRKFFSCFQDLKNLVEEARKNFANYVYLFMIVSPFSQGIPPLPLAFFSTNNKFNSENVRQYWEDIRVVLSQAGFRVFGFASDGDPRFIKMQAEMLLQQDRQVYQFQDFLHLFLKLINRIRGQRILIFGNAISTAGNLQRVSNKASKIVFEGNMDKQSVFLASLLFRDDIVDLLNNGDLDQQFTAFLLLKAKNIYELAANNHLSLLEKILKLVNTLYFTRIWKKHLKEKLFKEKGNIKGVHDFMFTSNCLNGLEINVFSLLAILEKENGFFAIWECSSQRCERAFRYLRSFKRNDSNFSVLEFESLLRKYSYSQLGKELITLKNYRVPDEVEASGRELQAIEKKENILQKLIEEKKK